MKASYTSIFNSKNLSILILKIILISIVSLFILPDIIPFKLQYRKIFLPSSEVYTAIDKSLRSTEGVRALVLGDSLGNQLYSINRYNDKIYSLACNQAVSLAGQYVLLTNFIKNNDVHGIRVYLVYHPESFSNNLDQNYTFNYFIKPFYSGGDSSLFTNTVKEKIRNIPYHSSPLLPIIKLSILSPDFNPDLSFKISFTENDIPILKEKYLFSEVSIEYLKKINELAKEHHFEFKVVSPFLRAEFGHYEDDNYSRIIVENGLEKAFAGYFDFKKIDGSYFSDNFHYADSAVFGKNPLNF